jgi:hypothetical protein
MLGLRLDPIDDDASQAEPRRSHGDEQGRD